MTRDKDWIHMDWRLVRNYPEDAWRTAVVLGKYEKGYLVVDPSSVNDYSRLGHHPGMVLRYYLLSAPIGSDQSEPIPKGVGYKDIMEAWKAEAISQWANHAYEYTSDPDIEKYIKSVEEDMTK